jgi:hypothetical protein
VASKGHDFIVASISRKIRGLGFNITYVDGEWVNISVVKHPIPPKILNHKPDVIGENTKGNYCIGEAKTINDIKSKRTKQQLIDFSEFVNLYSGNFLIVGIPLNAEDELNKLLRKLNLICENLIIIRVPDLLLK